jgi:hypothetical protein
VTYLARGLELPKRFRVALAALSLLIGLLLIPSPCPGTPFLIAALTLLTPDYRWAQRLQQRFGRMLVRAAPHSLLRETSAEAQRLRDGVNA